MEQLRTSHIEFNFSNFDTVMGRVNTIKERMGEIRKTETDLRNERNRLADELKGTEELIERTKRQNPEHFLTEECNLCDDNGKLIMIDTQTNERVNIDQINCPECDGKGISQNKEFIERNNFIEINDDVYGYVLDNNGKKVHVYNIKCKKTICKTINHSFQIVDESTDQCSICKREFEKLKR